MNYTCKAIIIMLLLSIVLPYRSYSEQSTIIETEGYSCMGEEKSRKQTKDDALIEAKRKALEFTITHINSKTEVKNFQVVEDVIDAYSHAEVKILELNELGWYKDAYSGECYKLKIKAEIIPNYKDMERVRHNEYIKDNPSAPLNVQVWTDKDEYMSMEKIKIYIKGNKPFYGRVVCIQNNGQVVQILPNPYRNECYFNGGVIYEIPSAHDRFELEVSPPFGIDQVILYGSTAELGQIDLETAGAMYKVKTEFGDIGNKTRGLIIKKEEKNREGAAEFSESKTAIKTSAR